MITFNLPSVERLPEWHALIDADCVAYWGSATAENLPLVIALRQVDLRMDQILDETQAMNYTGYLTGKFNFRDDICTLQRYKGNRYDKDGIRIATQPKWLQECRIHLEIKWGCLITDGQEADDALGIHRATKQTKDVKFIISSIDKDLKINPGWHHDMNTGEILEVKNDLGTIWLDEKKKLRGTGLHFFYAQMLMGDSADWIKGLPKVTEFMKGLYPEIRRGGCGQMAAWYMLRDFRTAKDLHTMVWEYYKSYWADNSYKHWRTGKVYKAGLATARKQFIEQGRLLWMRQAEGEMWKSPYELL